MKGYTRSLDYSSHGVWDWGKKVESTISDSELRMGGAKEHGKYYWVAV